MLGLVLFGLLFTYQTPESRVAAPKWLPEQSRRLGYGWVLARICLFTSSPRDSDCQSEGYRCMKVIPTELLTGLAGPAVCHPGFRRRSRAGSAYHHG